jgi:hypothetical protein
MRPTGQSQADAYRQRAARARHGAEHAQSAELRQILLQLAAGYDDLAGACGKSAVRRDDDIVMFRRVRCRFRKGAAVLYYLD